MHQAPTLALVQAVAENRFTPRGRSLRRPGRSRRRRAAYPWRSASPTVTGRARACPTC